MPTITPEAPGRDGRHGAEGRVCRRRGAVEERYSCTEIPDRTWHCYLLGRHGEDLAPHFLQRAPHRAGGALRTAHRGAAQPEGEPREDDPDHVRDLLHPGDVRR